MLKKIKILYIISICLILFQFKNNRMTIKANESLITWEELSSNPDSNTTKGKISIANKSDDYSSSTITLPNDFQSEMTDFPEGIIFDSKQNLFLIDWSKVQSKSPTMDFPIHIIGTSNSSYLVSIQSTLNNGETINDKLNIEVTDDTTSHSENENSSIDSTNSPGSLLLSQDVTSSSYSSAPESTVNENETSQNDSQIEESSELIESKSEENTIQTFAATTNASTVSVSTWSQFEDALANSNIYTININNDIPREIKLNDKPVNGDKIINGNGKTIDFYDQRFNIHNYDITFNSAVVTARQSSIVSNSSLFYSETGGKLTINNISFDGTQSGQVARLPEGEIVVNGNNNFNLKGSFEVLEANKIVFNENSKFSASNSDNKELINLYGNASIDLKNGAEVSLNLNNISSIINGGVATINIGENAKLNIVGASTRSSSKSPLVNLSGTGSNINIAQNATLNIRNNQTRYTGALISMNGSINFNTSSKKIEYWNQGDSINTDTASGQNYIKFPRVYDGIITLSGSTINDISVSSSSSLSKSDNSSLDGKQISDLLNKPTTEIKRLVISPAESIEHPTINRLTDTDVKLTGEASPGLQVRATDEHNNVWTTIDDSESGEFELDLGTFAPYKVGSKINVTVTDGYGEQSKPLEVIVAGNRLSFNVPSKLEFQQVAVKDEQMTIQRENPEWQIEVINTKGFNPESPWKLTAKASGPLTTEDGHTIQNALVYKNDSNTFNLDEQRLIYQQVENDPQEKQISWTTDQGLLLELNPIEQDVAYYKPYTTKIEWTLTDAP